jgi:hypothetical protein
MWEVVFRHGVIRKITWWSQSQIIFVSAGDKRGEQQIQTQTTGGGSGIQVLLLYI